ncbi:MAG: septum formation initiator family protein [Clostridiales bacterium]
MKRRKIKMKFVFFCIMVISSIFFSVIYIEQQTLIDKKLNDLNRVEDNIEKEKQISAELEKEKLKLNTDDYIERIARNKLGMVKPGEKVYIDINNN